MSEVWKIVLTSTVTIVGGVIVYALGHLFVALFIDPIHRLRGLIGEIADSLIFYADIYSNPGYAKKELCDEASKTLRRHASQLSARQHSIPCYHLWSLLRLVRKKTDIEAASSELIGLSNSVYGNPRFTEEQNTNRGIENDERRKRIEEILGIRINKNKQVSEERKGKWNYPLDRYALGRAILFLIFATILWGLPGSKSEIWLFRGVGIMAIVATTVFTVAILRESWEDKLKRFLEKKHKSLLKSCIQGLYWGLYPVAFMIAYIKHWLDGLSGGSAEEIIFQVMFWIGFALFFIIGLVLFRPTAVSFKNLFFRKHKV